MASPLFSQVGDSMKYDINILRHSKEERQQLKTFINLDNNKIGIEFDDKKTKCRYFFYKGKKKNADYYSEWVDLNETQANLGKPLYNLVKKYYRDHDRLVDGELPMYTSLELGIPITHLFFHVNAGTLDKVLTKEIIYF